jgi:hypothetical protein
MYTWESWCIGIKAHLERPAFKHVFDEVRDDSGFTYLGKLVDSKYESDPDGWFNSFARKGLNSIDFGVKISGSKPKAATSIFKVRVLFFFGQISK